MEKQSTFYLDMDGVVADFDAAAEAALGIERRPQPINGHYKLTRAEWAILIQNQRLYRDLPLMHRADELVDLARQYRDRLGWQLLFLTAVPKENDCPWAFSDKVQWARERFPDIAVHFGPYSIDKYRHCRPGDILVDDRTDNCGSWRDAHGYAVQVKNRNLADAIDLIREDLDRRMSFVRLRELSE